MKIAVCIDTTLVSQEMIVNQIQKVLLEPDAKVKNVIEPASVAALQLAHSLCEKGDSITAVSYGGPSAAVALEFALAFGITSVVNLTNKENPETRSSDPREIANALAQWLQTESFDLIICGNTSGTGPIPSLIAGYLNIPCLPRVYHANHIGSGEVELYQRLERGWNQKVLVKLPAVLTVQAGFFSCKYVSVRRKLWAQQLANSKIEVIQLQRKDKVEMELSSVTPPKPRAKRTAVPDAKANAADRLKLLMGGGIGGPKKTSNTSAEKEDENRVIEGPPDKAAKEIISFLEKKELLPEKLSK